jgi:Asp-tRNA(Asn)/Glu-tRNA(Gln) amidotransferase A subunit family amidase
MASLAPASRLAKRRHASPYYQDLAKRALLKPEAVFEIESGLKLSGFDITAASLVRTEWYQSVRRFFERYDYLVAPTAQLFPFDVNMHWPNEVAGRRMETYHEWMKGMVLVTMSGCPALAAPAGFSDRGLPIGIQIVAPNHAEPSCLQLAHAYDVAPIGCLAGILRFSIKNESFQRIAGLGTVRLSSITKLLNQVRQLSADAVASSIRRFGNSSSFAAAARV